VQTVAPEMRSGDVVAILSNGGFGGIYDKLPARLRILAGDAGSSNSANAAGK
jgi:UDP-N-acetylmuramate: L-alanyl-gamma-D-glutamyl-meso-diaminopimelate ligase